MIGRINRVVQGIALVLLLWVGSVLLVSGAAQLSPKQVDHLILGGVWAGAVAYTVFTPAYLWWAFGSWNRTLVGWALASAATSTALLLDLTLAFRVWSPSVLVGLWVTLFVVALIAVGGILKCAALGWEMWHHRHPPSPTDH